MSDFDDAMQRGLRNQFVMDLATNHCAHMEFVRHPGFGVGMVEQATGIPIGMRSVECKHVEQNTLVGAPNYEESATRFFEEHCVGCSFQNPNGRLPTLGSLVAERAAACRQVDEARAAAGQAEHNLWEVRSNRRKAMRLEPNAAVVALSRDLDDLDFEPGTEAPDQNESRLRMEATATRAPELFSEGIIDALFDLVVDNPSGRTLEPLRLLSRRLPKIRARVLDAALSRLEIAHDQDAGRCLVELREQLSVAASTSGVCRSAIMLAGAPVEGVVGHLESNGAAEGEPLRVVADIAPERVLETLDSMLPGGSVKSGLAHPFLGRVESLPNDPRSEWIEKVERAAAGASIQLLLPTHEELAISALPLLIRNLERPGDQYDHHPVRTVVDSIAAILLRHDRLVDQVLDAGQHADDDYRAALFDVFEAWIRLAEPSTTRKSKVKSPLDAEEIFAVVLPHILGFIDGRWGWLVASDAGRLVENMCSGHSRWAGECVQGLIGALIATHERPIETTASSLILPPSADPGSGQVSQIEMLANNQMRSSALSSLRRAIISASAGKPIAVMRTLRATLSVERETPVSYDVMWDFLSMVGDVATEHGAEDGLLNMVLPILRGYMVDAEPAIRSVALRAWTKIARKQPVPETLHDLLPALLNDGTVGVIRAVVAAAAQLDWREHDRLRLLLFMGQLAESAETLIDPFRVEVLRALLALTRHDSELHDTYVLYTLTKSMALDDMSFHDFFQHRRWDGRVAISEELGLAEWRFYQVERDIGIRDHDGERIRDLLKVGPGLSAIDSSEVADLAVELAVDSHWTVLTLGELTWRSHGWSAAKVLFECVLAAIPKEKRHARIRSRIQLLLDWEGSEGKLPPTDETVAQFLSEPDSAIDPLFRAYEVRREIRVLLAKFEDAASASLEDKVGNERLRELAKSLHDEGSTDTDTGFFIRSAADLVLVASHTASVRVAALNADTAEEIAHRAAVSLRLVELESTIVAKWDERDPLRIELQGVIDAVRLADLATSTAACTIVGNLLVPPIFVKGPERNTSTAVASDAPEPEDRLDVAVALFDIDGKTITGPQVLRPERVYRLGVALHMEEWPSWASVLEGVLVTDLTESEITLPTFRWLRPSSLSSTEDHVFTQDGTLICRFTKGPNAPAPRFRLDLRWRGQIEGRPVVQRIDVAAHREIQLRPFDATSDALTENGPFDERLIDVFDRLRAADTDEAQVQAFARLLSAIARASLEIAWSKQYKRGSHVTERQFHDDLYRRLMADPQLEGRVERGVASGLGFNDLRHDGITAELKVEKLVPETKERSAKYISQTAQYASSDGARTSILCVLDITRKEAVVAPPENYLWVLQPPVHALPDPRYPPAVAVHVINAWSPSPSSWSRKRAPVVGE